MYIHYLFFLQLLKCFFIIITTVGAGSAGAVIANRLSESGSYRVLLLEAGGDPSPYSRIPSFAPFNLHQTTDWNYRTEPQSDSCFSVDEQVGFIKKYTYNFPGETSY